MAITGDHLVGVYEGHLIELVRNNWNKTLSLLIDGKEAASASRALPHEIKLTGTFVDNGVEYLVEALSKPHLLTANDTITVNGKELTLEKKKGFGN